MKYFLAIYTHPCKSYCDKEFFTHLDTAIKNYKGIVDVFIVVNGPKKDVDKYIEKIHLMTGYHCVPIYIETPSFLKNVFFSVSLLREMFIRSECYDHFAIIESDVIVPIDIFDWFTISIAKADTSWGLIGGLYYQAFHEQFKDRKDMFEHGAVFSGCTVYNKKTIFDIKFRINLDNPGCFPDSHFRMDAIKKGYKAYIQPNIQCAHLTFLENIKRE